MKDFQACLFVLEEEVVWASMFTFGDFDLQGVFGFLSRGRGSLRIGRGMWAEGCEQPMSQGTVV